jgi:hypothetical protein
MTEQGKDTPLVNTLEVTANAPTAFERALDDWSRRAPGSELASLAMHRMVIALAQEIADEREIVRAQGRVIVGVGKQARENYDYAVRLEDRLRILERGQPIHAITTLETGTAQPTMRTRIQHTHTLKEGWRLAETTVEWSGAGEPDEAAIRNALIQSAHLGQLEAAARNAPPVADGDGGL